MSQNQSRIILFANGAFPGAEKVISQIQEEDYLIAVDGGLSHMVSHNLTPNLIIGDLDSADPRDVAYFEAQGVPVKRYPCDKNETDLELALEAALKLSPATIWITAALGKRLDQTLGSISLLTRPDLKNVDIRLIDGHQEVFLVRKSAAFQGAPSQRVSLLPLGGPVQGVHTDGLKYPLLDETLYPNESRGISNQMTGNTASLTIKSGVLICIHELKVHSERNKAQGSRIRA